MKIELKEITIRELTQGYMDNAESGVVGYGGRLDIRPPYQREFIYKDTQRNAVIDTVAKEFPLNVMYWAVREDNTYEVIDGQQRIISICQYVNNDFSVSRDHDILLFSNLKDDQKDQILNYKLMVYFCTGKPSEKLAWFRTINIAGEKLTDQEMKNAVFAGSWVTDAKRYFSKNGCAAYGIGNKYLKGTAIRQEYLETAIKWISHSNIDIYMSQHQHDPNANELWLYFQGVMNWVQVCFPRYRGEMKGIEWGILYDQYKDKPIDSTAVEKEISRLMEDEDIESKKGIYLYILTSQEKYLNIRSFSLNQKREAYERQKGICAKCNEHFTIEAMEGDHITPWCKGGKTDATNCQMLCQECNRRKSGF
ncbi:MAG: DUF262 domain-containing protein [Alistipes sp.]